MLGYMALFSILITAMMLTSAYIYYRSSVTEALAFGYRQDNMYLAQLREQFASLNQITLISAVVTTAILLMGGLILSHRIVGPLMRFKSDLEKIGESGQLHPITFREKDYFKDLAETFNREMAKYAEKNK